MSEERSETVRINVYDEEITGEVSIVTKTTDTGITFIGHRIFLDSPSSLHHSEIDDDRSAITFWYNADSPEEKKKVLSSLQSLAHVFK